MTIYVNAIMYYKVSDAAHCLTNVDDASTSAQLIAATTLRNCLGTRLNSFRNMNFDLVEII